MTEQFKVWLENPPSVNHIYGRTKQGWTFLNKKGKDFKGIKASKTKPRVPGVVDEIFRKAGLKPFPADVKVVVEVTAIWPNRIPRDMNNYAKIVCDALEETGYVPDDKMILWREMDWWIEKDVHGLMLTIYPLEG